MKAGKWWLPLPAASRPQVTDVCNVCGHARDYHLPEGGCIAGSLMKDGRERPVIVTPVKCACEARAGMVSAFRNVGV